MKLEEVRVRNFRSVEDTKWVSIQEDITTLLGANESGKTSFLKALEKIANEEPYDEKNISGERVASIIPLPIASVRFRVDESQKFGDENPLADSRYIHVRKYSNGARRIVSAKKKESTPDGIVNREYIEKTLDSLQDYLTNFRFGNDDEFTEQIEKIEEQIKNIQDPETPLSNGRLKKVINLLNQIIDSTQEDIDSKSVEKVILLLAREENQISSSAIRTTSILDKVPTILYQDSADLLDDKVRSRDVNSEDHRTFHNLMKVCGVDIREYRNFQEKKQARVAQEMETTIQGKVNEIWEQKSLDVTIRYNSNYFFTLIKDKEINGTSDLDRKFISPSQRSRGFQWFFSFYINLQASASTESENTIILLDDPAVFLHPEGKRNWLDAIEEIADENQILYTSHSPYLIRKEYPSRIRIVEDREGQGTVITDDFLESNEMSLEPLRKALGIGLGDSPFAAKWKILVEGPSDYYILTGLANYFKEYLDKDIINWGEVTILPVDGADNMVQASEWVMSEEFSYAILLDNDGKGNNVIDRLQDEAPTVEQERVFQLERDDEYQNFHIEIEDMFRTEFYINCLNTAYDAELDDFDPIEISDTWGEEGVSIEGVTYKQRKIVSKLNDILEDRGLGKLDKSLVAREIQDRLTGGDADEEDVKQFYPVMEKLRRTMPR